MSGFKITCNKCGKKSIVQQSGDSVDIKRMKSLSNTQGLHWKNHYNNILSR